MNHSDDLAHVADGLGDHLDALLVFGLLRTAGGLWPRLDADLRDLKITSAQFDALLALRSAGSAGLAMGELGRCLVVTKSNITGLVDRLERAGWARRAEGGDRRTICVQITPAGEALLKRAVPAYAGAVSHLTGCLAEGEKHTLIRLLARLRKALRHADAPKGGA